MNTENQDLQKEIFSFLDRMRSFLNRDIPIHILKIWMENEIYDFENRILESIKEEN